MGAGAGGVATKLHKICVKLYDNDLGAWAGREAREEEVEQLTESGEEEAARTRKWRANFAHSQQLHTHTHTLI